MNMALLQGAVWYDPNANYKPRSAGLAQKKMYKDCLLSLSQRFNTFFFSKNGATQTPGQMRSRRALKDKYMQREVEGGSGRGEWLAAIPALFVKTKLVLNITQHVVGITPRYK